MTNQNTALVAIQTKTPSALLDRASFARAVAIAASVVDKRNTIPVLSNLGLFGDGAGLAIVGTDLDLEIKVRIEGAADSDFAATIPAHMLKDILNKAKASDMAAIDLVQEGRADIDLGGVKFKLQTLPPEDFPEMPKPTMNTRDAKDEWIQSPPISYSMASADLIKGLDRIRFAISTEETRYYLNGAFMHFEVTTQGNFLRLVSTDGHRLALFRIPAVAIPADLHGVIVPTKAVKAVLAVYNALKREKQAPDMIHIDAGNSKIRFTLGNVEILAKLIDGTFPDVDRVIPRHNEKCGLVNVKAFDSAIEQVELISLEKSRAVKLTFSEGACKLEVNNPNAGCSETTVSCDYSSDPIEIGFNARYLRNIMAEIEGDEFGIELNDAGCPTVFNDPKEPRFQAVLMPMRV